MSSVLLCSCGCGGALHDGTAATRRLIITVRPVGPAAPIEPVTLADAKLHLRVEPGQTLEDTEIQLAITAARERIELDTEASWAAQTLEATYQNMLDPQRPLPLARGPVQAVDLVESVAPDGMRIVLSGWRLGVAEAAVFPSSSGWPLFLPPSAVVITYSAGPPVCPAPIRQAILLLVGQWYDQRAAVHVGSPATTMPYGLDWLIHGYRKTTGVVIA